MSPATWPSEGLAGLLILLTTLLVAGVAWHARGHLREHGVPAGRSHWLWPLLAAVWGFLTLIWLVSDLLTLYLALEGLGFCAVALMWLPGTREARRAGLYYLLASLSGSALILTSALLLYRHYGHLDFALLAQASAEDPQWRWLALAGLSTGLLVKAGAFPLHTWLPPAHATAWAPVSALHAALIIKASLFLLIKLWWQLGPAAAPSMQLLGWLGAAAVLWGGLLAWRQATLKKVVAYSTVSQMGYLLLLFPLMASAEEGARQLAWQATWLLFITHALAKAAMFMAAGNLVLAMGCDDLKGLTGVGQQLPLSLLVFGVAGVSIMGLPPSGAFTAKWLLLESALAAGQWPWLLLLGLGSLLSAAYLFRVFAYCFTARAEAPPCRRVPSHLDIVPLGLALAALFLGLIAGWPVAWVQGGGLP